MRISDWSSDVCSSDLARDDCDNVDGEPPGRAMARERYRFFCAREDSGQLLAEQHEDDAVERELDRVPHRIAAHPRDRHRLPRYFGESHGHAGAHRSENARGMDMLGKQERADRKRTRLNSST